MLLEVRMHSAGPKGPTEKRSAELIGGLYLVGAKGKCCAVITERQLTIERIDGKGVRLDLAAIERMRHLKVPMLPSGTILLGVISLYLGITTIVAPISFLAMGLGASVIVANIVSRYAILAIETGSGDRHLVSGSEANLLKLCLMVDRIRHGSGIEEALVGLENLETELPTFPAIRDATGKMGPKDSMFLPEPSAETIGNEVGSIVGAEELQKAEGEFSVSGQLLGRSDNVSRENDVPWTVDIEAQLGESKQNAYERAWGGREAPSWYKEKEVNSTEESRIESAFSDATEGLDMFAPGGLFDSGGQVENDEGSMEAFGSFGTDNYEVSPDKFQSSSQMIKRAHEEFGAPIAPYSKPLLPPPTEEAVREECKAGVVKQAIARQELRSQKIGESAIQKANLEDYPALNKLASTMGGSGIPNSKLAKRSFGTGWIGRLLSPGSSFSSPQRDFSRPKQKIETERFQTSQHMRLRSDQDHQAEVGSRIRSMGRSEISTARDKLDSIVRSVSNGYEEAPMMLESPRQELKFKQLRPTSSKEDPHPLPGLRRLG
ncbi:MAG: hypothetical protein CMA00_000220 [Methanobacteriota archaeon]|nr:MAG: hypothetical protein CMA00_000220 [Euryarchaeota archaeon]